ncbi:MAG: hypothetical protein K2F63_06765, partial [Muribaculaceae bacterium]|nr:hypothetical protein [Muribaculaceae bacterium]
ITPEQRAAAELADELELGCDMKIMRVDDENVVVSLVAPPGIVGEPYGTLDLKRDGLRLVAASRPRFKRNILGLERPEAEALSIAGTDEKVEASDSLTLFGPRAGVRDFYRRNS